jgi:serine/threonine protein kinase/tetratricopeptide (TPR) repeat protein
MMTFAGRRPPPADAPTLLEVPSAHPPQPSTSELPTMLDLGSTTKARPATPASSFWQLPALLPGTLLGGRYEIRKTIGEGGMGAVYQAEDRELGRTVALKVIRPELASNPDILQRFKQEILLASRITDRNIIRIYDLGDADGVKFITMEYLEGEDLRLVLQRLGKLSPDKAVEIMEQVASGLEAAHRLGIVHRDLKPGNIMLGTDGRVHVMDFGLARSLAGDGMTRTGTMLGTMEYMSPEQAQALEVDARSDIFTVGLILYELITGNMPFQADSAIASLLKRTQQRAVPMSEIDKNVPGVLSNIVSKCLERDPALRYQSAGELLADLRAWQGKSGSSKVSVSSAGLLMNRARELPRLQIVSVAVFLILVVSATFWYVGRKPNTTASTHTPISVLVADFQNSTSDAVFDGTLEPAFNLALEEASFINSFSRGDARKAAAQLNPGSTSMDESLARLVAQREGVSVVVSGSISPDGQGYKIAARAIDSVSGKVISSDKISVQNKDDVLHSVAVLASKLREAMGDATPESAQLLQMATFSSASLEATHQYALGRDLSDMGKYEDAAKYYQRAIELDSNMGRAYAALANLETNVGQTVDAGKYYDMAMARIDRMSDREKYRTRAEYFLFKHEPREAIPQYSALVKQFPADTSAHSNMALAYFELRDFPMALQEGRLAVQYAGKSVLERNNLALFAVYAGDFATGEKYAAEVIQQDPSYLGGAAFGALAMAQMGQAKVEDARQTYQKLAALGARGSSLSKLGLADIALYEGKPSDAIPILESGLNEDLQSKDSAGAAVKSILLGQAYLIAGRNSQAVAAAEKAAALDKQPSTLHAAGAILSEAGQAAKAQSFASRLDSSLDSEPQLYGKLLEAEIALDGGKVKDAVLILKDAGQKSDTWIGHFLLGRSFLKAHMYPEASSEIETCFKRRGEASALYLDDLPTFRLFPPVYYYMGRVQEELKSPAASDSYRSFLAIEGKGTGPLVTDAQKRLTTK